MLSGIYYAHYCASIIDGSLITSYCECILRGIDALNLGQQLRPQNTGGLKAVMCLCLAKVLDKSWFANT